MRSSHDMLDKGTIPLVESFLQKAIACNASDVHLEPMSDRLRVRFRIDGVLIDQEAITKQFISHIITRLKVLACIDIAQKRIPQDGKFHVTVESQSIDLRVSTFPTIYGEKVVIRILDKAVHTMSLDNLGLHSTILEKFKELIYRSSGLFLVTGPTGSGKTTTLYALLSILNTPEKNIMTLEDPVEYSIDGIVQTQINPAAGFSFGVGIRSLLRQDPDILMVGEIRDTQTARIAIEAALTGHLVLSTLHTNDAPSAIIRLMDMGIEPFLINASLTGVLAQRLARTICSQCCSVGKFTEQERSLVNRLGVSVDIVYTGLGCDHCNHVGYKGRTGIFELLSVSSGLRSLIVQQPIFDLLYARARDDGMSRLVDDGIQKVSNGTISLSECARALL